MERFFLLSDPTNKPLWNVISNFSIFFTLEWSTLSVELSFTTIAVFLAKLADFSCSIMASVVMASYFWKNLRNG